MKVGREKKYIYESAFDVSKNFLILEIFDSVSE